MVCSHSVATRRDSDEGPSALGCRQRSPYVGSHHQLHTITIGGSAVIFEETVVLSRAFGQATADVKAALAAVGFGTLTEIDMQATLDAKIGKQIDPYVIVGACNPHLASRALDADPQIGVLLPCNVVVRQSGDDVIVEAMDPGLMASMTANKALAAIAAEARELLNDALSRLSAPAQLAPGN